MKLPLLWLRQHIDLTKEALDVSYLASLLTHLGLEVEGVKSAPHLEGLKLVRVEEVASHPQADRLSLCRVSDGCKDYSVVCGAPNVRQGMMAIYAPLGAVIPQHGMIIEKKVIRGVASEGMLCSAAELCVGDDDAGILDVGDKTPLTVDVKDILGVAAGTIFDIALTPDRGDAASIFGLARDLAAAGAGKLKQPSAIKIKECYASPISISLEKECGCPYFTGRVLRGLSNGESPLWLKMALMASGLRSISCIVDVTNYIMLEYGHPLHGFDASILDEGIHVRRGVRGESFVALDGENYALDETMLVVATKKGHICSLAGVMGGFASGVSPQTTSIFLESAYFEAHPIAVAGRKLGMVTESRYRFERNADAASVLPSLDAATALILSLCGGEASSVVVAGTMPPPPPAVRFRHSEIENLGGLSIEDKRVRSILADLGFRWIDKDYIEPPSWRVSVMCEADVIGEIVRMVGLQEIKEEDFHFDAFAPTMDRTHNFYLLKQSLAARGFSEAVTWSFVSATQASFFGEGARLTNPMHQGQEMLRPSLLPRLLESLHANHAHGRQRQSLFEMGTIWNHTQESHAIAAVRMGKVHHRHWRHHWRHHNAKDWDVFDMKAEAEQFMHHIVAHSGLVVDEMMLAENDMPAYLHSGRGGRFIIKGHDDIECVFGMLHPAVQKAFDLEMDVAVFEVKISLDTFHKGSSVSKRRPLWHRHLYPALSRDFAFVVEKDCPAERVLGAARQGAGSEGIAVELFDLFEGGDLAHDKKSLGVSVTWQPQKKTMDEATIQKLCQNVIDTVCAQSDAVIRDGDGTHS